MKKSKRSKLGKVYVEVPSQWLKKLQPPVLRHSESTSTVTFCLRPRSCKNTQGRVEVPGVKQKQEV